MYTLYYLLFNTVYIKNNPTCFEPCHSLSSGTQIFIKPAIYVRYSLKYISWVDKMRLTVLSLWSLYLLLRVHHLFASGIQNCIKQQIIKGVHLSDHDYISIRIKYILVQC
jgi:hypothetical protein